MGGVVSAFPVATRRADGHLEVFVRGMDGALWHAAQLSNADDDWAPWTSLGGQLSTLIRNYGDVLRRRNFMAR